MTDIGTQIMIMTDIGCSMDVTWRCCIHFSASWYDIFEPRLGRSAATNTSFMLAELPEESVKTPVTSIWGLMAMVHRFKGS